LNAVAKWSLLSSAVRSVGSPLPPLPVPHTPHPFPLLHSAPHPSTPHCVALHPAPQTLVNMSGFDSVPADAGTFFLADAARRRLGMGVHKVQAFMSGTGTISGGTIASGLNIARQPAMKAMVADPFLLFPAEQVARAGTGSPTTLVVPAPDVAFPAYRPDFDSTAVPFIMAAINTRIVRRTNGLLAAHSKALAGHPHMLPSLPAGAAVSAPRYRPQAVAAELLASEGNVVPGPATSPNAAGSSGPVSRGGSRPSSKLRSGTGPEAVGAPAPGTAVTLAYSPHYPFAYTEAMLVPMRGRVISYVAGLLTALVMAIVNLAMASPLLVGLMARFLPAPGTGGSRQQMARSWFHYDLIGTADDTRQTVAVRVSGGDGGYADTARMLSEAGILLALERASLPATAVGGGFLTPAVAFGRRLIEVLGPAGISFEVLSAGPTPPPVARLREKGRNPGVSAASVGAGSTGAASSTAAPTA